MEKSLKNIDDAYKWSLETVAALRAGDFSRIDTDELINEIGSIASGLRREMTSLLRDIIEALLILTYTEADKKEPERQLVHAQGQLQLLLHSAPTLREAIAESVDKAYQRKPMWPRIMEYRCLRRIHSHWSASPRTRMSG